MLKIDYKKYFALVLFSIPNTFLSIGLLYIINVFLTGDLDNLPVYLIPVFFCFILYSYLLNILFQTKLVFFNYSMVYDNEVKILKILHNTSLSKFEQHGAERFYSILEDLRVFVFLPTVLTTSVNALLTLFVCLGYLFSISAKTTVLLIIFIVLLVGLYYFLNKKLSKKYESLRVLNEEYYKFIDDSIKGFKELKISSSRSNNFFSKYLITNREAAKNTDISLTNKYLIINLVSQYGIYILIGFVLFFLSYYKTLNEKEIISYIIALLFLNGPINSLISMQNFITRAVVSNKRINTFFKDFNDPSDEEKVENHQELKYDELSFNNIYFSYNAQDEIQESFTVKDINFQVDKGEVVFIVGGNGSGKSTFINILTGLYKPLSGEILLNGKKIHNAHANYKKLFSVIYTDNYIFSKNYDDYILKGNKEYLDLLKMMEMESIITNDEDESVRRKFSKGQSKRMSLIFSLLEDRPILVLDEWAADQDPHFRKYFYETIIPKMKKQGKTIIAVTHDDKYFNYADRIIKFDSGQIIKDIAVKDNTPLNIL